MDSFVFFDFTPRLSTDDLFLDRTAVRDDPNVDVSSNSPLIDLVVDLQAAGILPIDDLA